MFSRRIPALPLRALMTAVLALSFAAAVAAPAQADDLPPGGTFVDDNRSVHEGYIEAIADDGITSGCGGSTYCPTDAVTRGEMAAFIRRARSLPASSTDWFNDDDGSRFEGDINALADAEITRGCGDGGGFCPGDALTRGEMAAFLRRALDLPASSTDHFGDDDSDVFQDDINALASAGITKGCNPPDNSRFCPDDRVTRGEMASFLGRALGLQPMDPPDRDPEDLSPREAISTWFPQRASNAIRVADCESSLNPRARNPSGYHGLFQIGNFHADRFERVTGVSFSEGRYVSYYNAQYAKFLHEGDGDSWKQWSCKP